MTISEALEPTGSSGAYHGFRIMNRLGVLLLPLDGMLVHRRSLPRNLLGFPTIRRYPFILLGGEGHCESKLSFPKTTQCQLPGLEPGPVDPGTSAITMHEATAPPSL